MNSVTGNPPMRRRITTEPARICIITNRVLFLMRNPPKNPGPSRLFETRLASQKNAQTRVALMRRLGYSFLPTYMSLWCRKSRQKQRLEPPF